VFADLHAHDPGLTRTGRRTHRRVGVYYRPTVGWRPFAQGRDRSAYFFDLNGSETRSRLGQIVSIIRKLWISSTFDFQRAPHLPHIRLLVRRFNSARPDIPAFRRTHGISIGEWLCSGPGLKTRRIHSRVLHEQRAPILRGNRTVVR
jgi:hypothetical protein